MVELAPWLRAPYAEFALAYEQQRLPGSVILSCAQGLGAEFLAAQMAKRYLCHSPKGNEPCGHCRSCLSFDRGEHPDFLRVPATDADEVKFNSGLVRTPYDEAKEVENSTSYVRIVSLRAMQEKLAESAAMGHGKVAVISEAHLMQVGAANAVLKTFEEPPEHTLIVMVTKSLESLLPTILSRAYKIRTAGPTFAQALDFMRGQVHSSGEEQLKLALSLSLNAPYGAIRLLNSTCKVGRSEKPLMDILNEDIHLLRIFFADPQQLEKVILGLKILPARVCARLLEELVVETLKYKAGVKIDGLPLLAVLTPENLVKLQAQRLFEAQSSLKFIAAVPPMPVSRAPAAQLRTWFMKLTGRI